MPLDTGYYSARQRRFFHTDTAREKGITQAMVDRRDAETKGKKLPEITRNKKGYSSPAAAPNYP